MTIIWLILSREKFGIKVNATHVAIKAIGEILKAAPGKTRHICYLFLELNGKIVLGKVRAVKLSYKELVFPIQ